MAGDPEQLSPDEIQRVLAQGKPSAAAGATPSSVTLRQDEVESLLRESGAAGPMSATPDQSYTAAGARPIGAGGLPASDIDFLFQQAEQALASVQGASPVPPGIASFKLVDFGGVPASTENATLDLLRDVELDLKIELGRTHMYLEDVLRLSRGAVVPLDRLAGDPVDIYVNGRLIARGEVLILNDNFCVRVAELVAGETATAQPN
jgi:flagellar motor switch protein FliN/FliY